MFGNVIGGWIVKKLHIPFPKMLTISIICNIITLALGLAFLLHCPQGRIVGVTLPTQVHYDYKFDVRKSLTVEGCAIREVLLNMSVAYSTRINTSLSYEKQRGSVSNACNAECSCAHSVWRPVCDWHNDVMYVSPCYAGCRSQVLTTTHYEAYGGVEVSSSLLKCR